MIRLLIALSMSVVMVYADDIRTNDGTVYKNAKITSHTPADVTIMHQSGIGHVPLSEMPAEVQRQFNYDPEKSAQYRAAEIAAVKASIQQPAPIAVQSALPRQNGAPAFVSPPPQASATAHPAAKQIIQSEKPKLNEELLAAKAENEAMQAEARGDHFGAELIRIRAEYDRKIRAAERAGNNELANELRKQAKMKITEALGRQLSH